MIRWKLLCILSLVATITSCGQNTKETPPEPSTVIETESQETSIEDILSEEKESSSSTETLAENTESKDTITEDDNFAVDSSEAEAFALKIKKAVSETDLEALADLAAFPMYIQFTEKGQSIQNREEFLALGKEKIFTEAWMDSIAQADETALSPSQAGFILTKENGAENVVFGLRNGELAITGINY